MIIIRSILPMIIFAARLLYDCELCVYLIDPVSYFCSTLYIRFRCYLQLFTVVFTLAVQTIVVRIRRFTGMIVLLRIVRIVALHRVLI